MLIWPGRPPSLRVESAVGSCLGSPSQLKPVKGMEFPLRIKQGSAWGAKQTEGRGGGTREDTLTLSSWGSLSPEQPWKSAH